MTQPGYPTIPLPMRVGYDAAAIAKATRMNYIFAAVGLALAIIGTIVYFTLDGTNYLLILIGVAAIGALAFGYFGWNAGRAAAKTGGVAWVAHENGLELAETGLLGWEEIAEITVLVQSGDAERDKFVANISEVLATKTLESSGAGNSTSTLAVRVHDPAAVNRRLAQAGLDPLRSTGPHLVRQINNTTPPNTVAVGALMTVAGARGVTTDVRNMKVA